MSVPPVLTISSEKVFFILTKARQFDVKDAVTDPDPGSNATDDCMISVLEDHPDDPVQAELIEIIRCLNEDEQTELVALTWLGRGDGGLDDWPDIRSEAIRARNGRTAEYLIGTPLLADYLEEAMSQFGHSLEESERPV